MNRLASATSPYLRQHADNPVHWWAWGPEVLDHARAVNRPLLLSIGYSACHWCHVMAHESFADPAVAAVMNDLFVNVKIDREERPDLDTVYQTALAHLGVPGGWPLTMFCRPDGAPFWGGTYFPPAPRHGRPGFPQILRHIARIWQTAPETVQGNATALTALLRPDLPAAVPAADPGARAESESLRHLDPRHGGLAGAPKFPQPEWLAFLWRRALASGNAALRNGVTLTLDRMAQGGLYDHLGGGFARYCVDEAWLVPHFEKMLYDNAQLISLYSLVWRQARWPVFAARVADTIGWLRREMRHPEGGFLASLDADSDGIEGQFYVWEAAEIDRCLGAEAATFRSAYGVTAAGNWEGRTILNRLHTEPGTPDPAVLPVARDRLLAARARRVRPGRDDKILADWNGMTIAALAEAAASFDRPDWHDMAEAAFSFVQTRMANGARLYHSFCAGVAAHPGHLDDYAQMIRAALALYNQAPRPALLRAAEDWLAVLDTYFRDGNQGGYFATASDTGDVPVRMMTGHDGATPAGNGLMVDNLLRLSFLSGACADRAAGQARAILDRFSGLMMQAPLACGALLNGLEASKNLRQVVLAGPGRQAMRAAIRASPCPDLVVQEADSLPRHSPAAGKPAVRGQPTAWICTGQVCAPPVTGAAALTATLTAACSRLPAEQPGKTPLDRDRPGS